MSRIISIFLGCFLLTGCIFFRAPDREKACNKIIPRATMARLLEDIYLLEGYLHETEARQPGIRDSVEYHYAWLFDTYNTTPWQFREALSCYLLDKEEMDLIHEQILSRFSLMESELDARAALEARRQEWQKKTESNRAQLGYPSLLLPLSWEMILQAGADTAAVRTNPPANDHQPDSVG
jgi:hypothetical protein